VIEVSPDSKNANIIEFKNIEKYKNIEDPERAIMGSSFKKFTRYTKGCVTVKLLIFKYQKSFDPRNIVASIQLARYIRKNKIDTIHFDGESARLFYMLPLISKKNIFLTIPDPIHHSGEKHWKTSWVRRAYLQFTSRIFFYSNFALKQYLNHNTKNKKKLDIIRLKPYTFISTYDKKIDREKKYILFFGRISYYKGIDILVESIKIVLESFPNEQFLIAGDFQNSMGLFNTIKGEKNIAIINKHIEIEELSDIIAKSKFIVCPYRDATQSGVLLTSFAMMKPVIATNVGSFPEYIEHGFNGLLSNPNHIDFAEQIVNALKNDRFKIFENNIRNSNQKADENENSLKKAYN
jgi:glycosyltransferase involved in cell wall biosynthesis